MITGSSAKPDRSTGRTYTHCSSSSTVWHPTWRSACSLYRSWISWATASSAAGIVRHRRRPPPGQRPGHFILAFINLHAYMRHTVRQNYLIQHIRSLSYRPNSDVFPSLSQQLKFENYKTNIFLTICMIFIHDTAGRLKYLTVCPIYKQ